MKPIVALPFRHQAGLVCEDARQMLLDAGFELACNETGDRLPREEQKALIANAFAIIAGTEKYDADMLNAAKNLKVIIRFGVGTDNFDLDAMRKKGIALGVIANYNSVAEFTLTLMLGAVKNLPKFDATVREGAWTRYPMRELSYKTVGIVGFGRIGRRLAELLKGFNVNLLVYDPYIDPAAVAELGATSVSLEKLLRQSDFVSLHLPATEQTRHLINAETLALMKPGAYLVNTSRGALVDEQALYDALVSKRISGAALDVYEMEPVKKGNPLFDLENIVLAPHVSAMSYETNYNAGITCAKSIIQVAGGGKPVYPI